MPAINLSKYDPIFKRRAPKHKTRYPASSLQSIGELDEPPGTRTYRNTNGRTIPSANIQNRKILLIKHYSLIKEGLIPTRQALQFQSIKILRILLKNSDILRHKLIPLDTMQHWHSSNDLSRLKAIIKGLPLLLIGEITYNELKNIQTGRLSEYFNSKLKTFQDENRQVAAEALIRLGETVDSESETRLRKKYSDLQNRISVETEHFQNTVNACHTTIKNAHATHVEKRASIKNRLDMLNSNYKIQQKKFQIQHSIINKTYSLLFARPNHQPGEPLFNVHRQNGEIAIRYRTDHDRLQLSGARCLENFFNAKKLLQSESDALEAQLHQTMAGLNIELKRITEHHNETLNFLKGEQQKIRMTLEQNNLSIPLPTNLPSEGKPRQEDRNKGSFAQRSFITHNRYAFMTPRNPSASASSLEITPPSDIDPVLTPDTIKASASHRHN